MHTNESEENYLETILILSESRPVVRSVDIAAELDFKKSSVSVAMKKLREHRDAGRLHLSDRKRKGDRRPDLRTPQAALLLAGTARSRSRDRRRRRVQD